MLVGSGWLFLSARRVAMRGYARCGGAARLVSCCWRGTFSAGRLLNEDAACVVHAGGIFDTIPLRLRAALLPARCVFASVAQGIEHRSPKAGVVRSNRIWGTTNMQAAGICRWPFCCPEESGQRPPCFHTGKSKQPPPLSRQAQQATVPQALLLGCKVICLSGVLRHRARA